MFLEMCPVNPSPISNPSIPEPPGLNPCSREPSRLPLPVFELCAEKLGACRVAASGGAHRIELCTALAVGGLTPEPALVEAAVRESGLPVHVLLRPSAATFAFTPEVMEAIAASLLTFKRMGVAGFVLGLLDETHRVDVAHTRALVALAHPLPVTFHRAFDATPDLAQALEDVIAAGCTRVLTSGGAPDVLTGAPALAHLQEQAQGRIEVAAGGGLTLENAGMVARRTGCRHFHGSLGGVRQGAGALQRRIANLVRALAEAQTLSEAQTLADAQTVSAAQTVPAAAGARKH